MNILNEDFAEKMNKLGNDNNLGLSKYEYDAYSNCFHVIYELTGKQFTFDEIFNLYDFFTDVLDGKRPDIDMFGHKDGFKGFYRLSKRYSTTKNLTEEQRINLAFTLYQAACIMTFDEKKGEPTWNMDMFEKGTEFLLKEFEYEKEQFPGKFDIKTYSDHTKDNYGFIVENPVEVTSVSTEYQYLDCLQTEDNKKIIYDRIGSFTGNDGIFVDGYDIFTKVIFGKKKIATIYITGDGIENSRYTPKGFKFIKE